MPIGFDKYEKMLQGVDSKSQKAIKEQLSPNTPEYAQNIVDSLKQSYTNVNSVLHRDDSNITANKKDIKRNKTLFKQLLKIAEKDNVDLDDLKNELIDRLERDLEAYKKSGKKMEEESHPLYEMGMAFVNHDINAEAKRLGAPAREVIQNTDTYTDTSKVAKQNNKNQNKGQYR